MEHRTGCDGYTKASQISSLQKYLRKGIKERDDSLSIVETAEPVLDQRPLELDGSRDMIEDKTGDIVRQGSPAPMSVGPGPMGLDGGRDTIKAKEVQGLQAGYKVEWDPGRVEVATTDRVDLSSGPEVTGSTEVHTIASPGQPGLDGTRIGLEGIPGPAGLRTDRGDITAGPVPEIDSPREGLPGEPKEGTPGKSKVGLPTGVTREVVLDREVVKTPGRPGTPWPLGMGPDPLEVPEPQITIGARPEVIDKGETPEITEDPGYTLTETAVRPDRRVAELQGAQELEDLPGRNPQGIPGPTTEDPSLGGVPGRIPGDIPEVGRPGEPVGRPGKTPELPGTIGPEHLEVPTETVGVRSDIDRLAIGSGPGALSKETQGLKAGPGPSSLGQGEAARLHSGQEPGSIGGTPEILNAGAGPISLTRTSDNVPGGPGPKIGLGDDREPLTGVRPVSSLETGSPGNLPGTRPDPEGLGDSVTTVPGKPVTVKSLGSQTDPLSAGIGPGTLGTSKVGLTDSRQTPTVRTDIVNINDILPDPGLRGDREDLRSRSGPENLGGGSVYVPGEPGGSPELSKGITGIPGDPGTDPRVGENVQGIPGSFPEVSLGSAPDELQGGPEVTVRTDRSDLEISDPEFPDEVLEKIVARSIPGLGGKSETVPTDSRKGEPSSALVKTPPSKQTGVAKKTENREKTPPTQQEKPAEKNSLEGLFFGALPPTEQEKFATKDEHRWPVLPDQKTGKAEKTGKKEKTPPTDPRTEEAVVTARKVTTPGEQPKVGIRKGRDVIPAYKLAGSWASYLNPSKYLRWVAENTVGKIPIGGSGTHQVIMDEALGTLVAAREKLEKKLGLLPWSLPGAEQPVKDAISGITDGADFTERGVAKAVIAGTVSGLGVIPGSTKAVSIDYPVNEPGSTKEGVYYVTDAGGDARSLPATPPDPKTSKGVRKLVKLASKVGLTNKGLHTYSPSWTYQDPTGGTALREVTGEETGLSATLRHLCPRDTDVLGFQDLKSALENSDYATTSRRVTGQTQTLDSNHIWEIIMEPYLGVENGEMSMLPSFHQINYENHLNFGMCTPWDTWIPFTSFELSSRKMVQKNLSLYSGEISVPQNLEFTNELRLVICDDQYKSWRRYFGYVMNSSVYEQSTVGGPWEGTEEYYKKKYVPVGGTVGGGFTESDLVVYSKNTLRVAPYKNLAFRVRILLMNPQYQTVRLSDLLVVLKEFSEEWQGEVDASPTELSLMFSVVGENPLGKSSVARRQSGRTALKKKGATLKSASYSLLKPPIQYVNLVERPGTLIGPGSTLRIDPNKPWHT